MHTIAKILIGGAVIGGGLYLLRGEAKALTGKGTHTLKARRGRRSVWHGTTPPAQYPAPKFKAGDTVRVVTEPTPDNPQATYSLPAKVVELIANELVEYQGGDIDKPVAVPGAPIMWTYRVAEGPAAPYEVAEANVVKE